MTPLTIDQQIENCETFLRYWATVPKRNVAKGLGYFRDKPDTQHTCNTIACAGGWLPAMPEFAAMGVFADHVGAPRLNDIESAWAVSLNLFGDMWMFSGRVSGDKGSDHAVVTRRFVDQVTKLNAIKRARVENLNGPA